MSNQLKQVDQLSQNKHPKSETNSIVVTDNLSPYILNTFVKTNPDMVQLSESHGDYIIQPHLTVSGMEVFHPPCMGHNQSAKNLLKFYLITNREAD